MLAFTGRHVTYKPELSLSMEDRPTMSHRQCEALVPGVGTDEEAKGRSGHPPFAFHGRRIRPAEGTFRLRLVLFIHDQRAVCRCSAIIGSLLAVSHVFIGARVSQKCAA